MPLLYIKADMIMGTRASALLGVFGLIVFPSEPQFYVLCGMVVTTVGSVILQLLKNRQEDKRRRYEDARYDRDREEREQHQDEMRRSAVRVESLTEAVKQDVGDKAKELRTELATNTQLTKTAVVRADQAYKTANHVNEKLAAIATGDVKVLASITADTNETVHRIEEHI